MKALILGSTGMLGQSLTKYFEKQNIIVHGVARSNADFNLDVVKELTSLQEIIEQNHYDVVINTIALINLAYCESNPEKAYLVNANIPGEISGICEKLGIYFVQISTDHFYSGDKKQLHTETDTIMLLNEYAKSKYLAEKLVEIYSNTLIIRTNIVGYRNNGAPTFVEWIINTLSNNDKITGYTNMYTSSIDVNSLARILYQLILTKPKGVYNVSANGVMSKFEFIYLLAEKFEKAFLVEEGYLTNDTVKRGDSLGLSIKKLEMSHPAIIIPTVHEVVDNLYKEYVSNQEG